MSSVQSSIAGWRPSRLDPRDGPREILRRERRQIVDALADAEIASEIYSTAGDFDLLVQFYVDPSTDIGHFVNEKVQTIPGIQDTRTIITFKAF